MLEKVPLAKLLGIPKVREVLTGMYERHLLYEIQRAGSVPSHVGIILDGNRRFAEERGMAGVWGHVFGAQKLEEALGWCQELGIKHVTVYAFSTENFQRSSKEVETLMGLFVKKFKDASMDERIHKYKIRLRALGDVDSLPESVRKSIQEAEDATKDYDGYTLNIAISYGGRAEITQAIQKICEQVQKGQLKPGSVDEKTIEKYLYTAGLPDPDLIIRTSGEERLSGFLLWQSAYSELYFCEANWPAFTKLDFLRSIRVYQDRQRRFGK
jgi:tritrans,polycis-undecaprenyl-diphosphate synthase [geranylgeranyl-diphosphate specific]